MSKKDWYCSDCRVYGTKKEIMEGHFNLNHFVKKRTPLEERLVWKRTEEVPTVTVDGETIYILPHIVNFVDMAKNVKYFTRPELSLQAEDRRIVFNSVSGFSGDLPNLAKKLSYGSYHQSQFISSEDLRTLLVSAIRQQKYVETQRKDVVKIFLVLDTSLKGLPKTENSKWVVCMPRDFRKSEDEILAEASRKSALAHKKAYRMRPNAPLE